MREILFYFVDLTVVLANHCISSFFRSREGDLKHAASTGLQGTVPWFSMHLSINNIGYHHDYLRRNVKLQSESSCIQKCPFLPVSFSLFGSDGDTGLVIA